MAAFIGLTIVFLMFVGSVCTAVWNGIKADTWSYDEQFLWTQYDLSEAKSPRSIR